MDIETNKTYNNFARLINAEIENDWSLLLPKTANDASHVNLGFDMKIAGFDHTRLWKCENDLLMTTEPYKERNRNSKIEDFCKRKRWKCVHIEDYGLWNYPYTDFYIISTTKGRSFLLAQLAISNLKIKRYALELDIQQVMIKRLLKDIRGNHEPHQATTRHR